MPATARAMPASCLWLTVSPRKAQPPTSTSMVLLCPRTCMRAQIHSADLPACRLSSVGYCCMPAQSTQLSPCQLLEPGWSCCAPPACQLTEVLRHSWCSSGPMSLGFDLDRVPLRESGVLPAPGNPLWHRPINFGPLSCLRQRSAEIRICAGFGLKCWAVPAPSMAP